ncbi:MAG: maleylpyruvate isomerase family mycothiol-dependent enzyme [Acidimicrobiia bacterium]|nr:maleylpyruvate isomerase family mycothiol-dependent enzyme [Acidimicrobiia bacterium]
MTLGGRARRRRDGLNAGGVPRRPAAELLLITIDEMTDRVLAAGLDVGGLATPCSEWTLHDVIAHCSGTVHRVTSSRLHEFTPASNQDDVLERRKWGLDALLDELRESAVGAASAIGAAGGTLDGIGIGAWIHLGDVRAALGDTEPFDSPGFGLALEVLKARSRRLGLGLVAMVGSTTISFGSGDATGQLATDRDTFIRLIAGRSPDPRRYTLVGATPEDLVLFR